MNYAELIAIVEDEIVDLDSTWDTHKGKLIERAQLRIENDLDLTAARVEDTLPATGATVSLPVGTVLVQQLRIQNGEYLLQKDRGFLREFWPNSGTRGTPRYYAYTEDGTLLLAPTPTSVNLEIAYTIRLPVLSEADTTNWLSVYAPNLLQYSLLLELAIWTKDGELEKVYKSEYSRALTSTALTFNLRKRMGEYRTGEPIARPKQ